jgi:hypothetical protein
MFINSNLFHLFVNYFITTNSKIYEKTILTRNPLDLSIAMTAPEPWVLVDQIT